MMIIIIIYGSRKKEEEDSPAMKSMNIHQYEDKKKCIKNIKERLIQAASNSKDNRRRDKR